ncbi:MAG: hypothetical protein F4139_03810 [Gemmatimonadetes bacterium]|nr:hypothetical protein [Gemmatimonadota bacterium]MYH52062.1 hypothetical protein [Gemmatimonadota bacterium]MYK65303.1 hypothetical protein [Gemmatimonadota bacterium]
MRKRIVCRVTGLLLATGLVVFAGGPGECGAQVRPAPDQKRLASSAAIEEMRRSPFHAGVEAGEAVEAHRVRTGIGIALAPSVLQLAQSAGDPPSRWSHVPATLVVAGLSHYAAALGCAFGGPAGCIMMFVPLVVTPIPALLAGAHLDRAFGASMAGLVLGAAAGWGAFVLTGGIHVAIAASTLVHTGMTTAAFGER